MLGSHLIDHVVFISYDIIIFLYPAHLGTGPLILCSRILCSCLVQVIPHTLRRRPAQHNHENHNRDNPLNTTPLAPCTVTSWARLWLFDYLPMWELEVWMLYPSGCNIHTQAYLKSLLLIAAPMRTTLPAFQMQSWLETEQMFCDLII